MRVRGVGGALEVAPAHFFRPPRLSPQHARQEGTTSASAPAVATTVDEEAMDSPFLDSFVRAFLLGVGAGGLCEVGHVGLKVRC